MKSVIRFVAILLSAVVLLCSCQGSEPEVIPEYSVDIESKDLGGFELYWGFAKSGSDEENVFGYIPGTALADAAYERMIEIQNNFNCTINMEYGDFGTVNSNMQAYVMSGSPHYDITTNEGYVLVNSVRAGYLTGLSSLIDVSNTDKWGTPGMLQSMLWKDDLYGVVPYAWPELMYNSVSYPIVVNEDLVSQYGHEDPREFVENGTWNWDKFEEVLHAYTQQESERTIYAMAIHKPYYTIGMFLSNGTAFNVYGENGVTNGIYTPEGIEALERAVRIYKETCSDCFHPDDAHGGAGVDWFVNGDIFMLTLPGDELLKDESSVMYRANNVGVLPYPSGPNASPNTYLSYHSSLLFSTVIPVNAKDPEASAIILSAMFEPFEDYPTRESIAEYMGNQIFFDQRDADILVNMISHAEYGFFKEGARAAIETVMNGNETVTVVLEELESKYQQILEDYLIPHYEGRIAVYGE